MLIGVVCPITTGTVLISRKARLFESCIFPPNPRNCVGSAFSKDVLSLERMAFQVLQGSEDFVCQVHSSLCHPRVLNSRTAIFLEDCLFASWISYSGEVS